MICTGMFYEYLAPMILLSFFSTLCQIAFGSHCILQKQQENDVDLVGYLSFDGKSKSLIECATVCLSNQQNCDALRYVAVYDVCQLINIDVDGSSVWNSNDNVWKVASTGQNIPKTFTTQSTSPIVTSSTFGAITTSILTTTSASTSETATTVPLVTTTPPAETTTPAAATTPAATTPTPATTTTVVGTTAPPTCAGGWQQYEGSCYLWVEIMYEWEVAKNNCESMGANLTSAANAGEDAFVYSIMGSGIWTSGNDMATEGTFMWSPHEAFTYINWSNNEPGGGTMENCMSIKGNTGRWADFACSQLFTSMCKKAV